MIYKPANNDTENDNTKDITIDILESLKELKEKIIPNA